MKWELNSDFTVQRVGNDKIYANSVATVIYRLTGDVLINDIVNINLVVNGITYNYNMLLDTDGSFYAISNGDELNIDSTTDTQMFVSFEIKKLSMLDNETVISTQTTQQVTEYIYSSAKYTPTDIASDTDKIYAEIGVVNSKLIEHINNKNNPHEVNKEQVGLGNADNTADSEKPLSNPQKEYIDAAVGGVPYVKNFNYEAATGVLKIVLSDNNEYSVDLPLELIVKTGYVDYETSQLVLVLANNEEIRITLTDLFSGYIASTTTAKDSAGTSSVEIKSNVYTSAAENNLSIIFSKDYADGGNLNNIVSIKETGIDFYNVKTGTNIKPKINGNEIAYKSDITTAINSAIIDSWEASY